MKTIISFYDPSLLHAQKHAKWNESNNGEHNKGVTSDVTKLLRGWNETTKRENVKVDYKHIRLNFYRSINFEFILIIKLEEKSKMQNRNA